MELAALRDEDRVSTDLVLRDPYLLDFLGLKDTYQEKDLEAAILREMERFILGWAAASRFWPGRSASRSTTRTSTSTCSSTSATCGGLWWWNSSSTAFAPSTRARWAVPALAGQA